ncbi:MAG: hypothetical protein ACXAAH_00985, partial [Promethearchaeota archaeon]
MKNNKMKITKYKIILIGFLLAVCFWIVEALLHTFIFNISVSFINNLLFPPSHEYWMRVIVLFVLIVFSILSQYIINKLHNMHEKLRKTEENLRKSFNRSKFYKDLFSHDVNNIFSIINSFAELISSYYKNPNKSINIEEYPDVIQDQI